MQSNRIRDHVSFSSGFTKIDETDFEIVERKGIGHPDTLADGLAEVISIAYSEYCLKKFGTVLHHNLDKISLIGGLVNVGFGEGTVIEPAKLILNGRMSKSFGTKSINIKEIQNSEAKKYLRRVLPNLDLEKGLEIVNFTNSFSHNPYWYHPRDRRDVPDSIKPRSNDSSACVGYWPLSRLENLILNMEGCFYKKDYSPKFDYIGQDIKFMAVRKKEDINITACIPFISTKTSNKFFYKRQLDKIHASLNKIAKQELPNNFKVNININAADDSGDIYLLLTGSCIEAGEEGVVGRGNKSRGIISSTRPHSMEACHGKNPVYHVGKVFTIIADSLSRSISETFDCECNVFITTKIGDGLYLPNNMIVETSESVDIQKVLEVIELHLTYGSWTSDIIKKKLLVPIPGGGNFYTIVK